MITTWEINAEMSVQLGALYDASAHNAAWHESDPSCSNSDVAACAFYHALDEGFICDRPGRITYKGRLYVESVREAVRCTDDEVSSCLTAAIHEDVLSVGIDVCWGCGQETYTVTLNDFVEGYARPELCQQCVNSLFWLGSAVYNAKEG